MRTLYALIILILVLFMTWEFDAYGKKFDLLTSMAERSVSQVTYIQAHCTCGPNR